MKIILILLLWLVPGILCAQAGGNKYILAGNDWYKKQKFEQAAEEYNRAIEADPGNGTAKFNFGNALFKQNKTEEALKVFSEITGIPAEKNLKANAHYNHGVGLSMQKKQEESIESYKNALRLNPGDKEARENLQKALLELKKKNPEKKKDEQKKKQEQEKKQEQRQSVMNPKEAEQRLQLLAQKEKEVQQRIQKEKSHSGGSQAKDW